MCVEFSANNLVLLMHNTELLLFSEEFLMCLACMKRQALFPPRLLELVSHFKTN